MAFLPTDPNQAQQPGQQQNQIPTVPQIPTLAGTSGGSAGQGTGTGSTNTASPGAAPSTPWQNITTYLQANAGQAGQVADRVAQGMQGQYDAANQGIQQANQNFGQQIESARVPLNQQVVQQAAAAPSQFVQDPNNVAAFQKMLNANYTGPQDFSHTQNFSDLQGQVQKAQGQAALANGGTEGLMTLIQQAEAQAGRNPTQGITSLDSLLLQEDPNNFTKISGAAAPFANLTGALGQTQQSLDLAAQNAAKEAAATQNQVQGQFMGPGGVIPTAQDAQNKALQALQGQVGGYNSEITDIMNRLSTGQQLTAQEMAEVNPTGELGAMFGDFQSAQQFPGISPGMLASYYGGPVKGMLPTPTAANALTPQQIADARALNQLIGQDALQAPANAMPYTIPTDKGSFQGKPAMQGLYDALNADQSYLPYMDSTQSGLYPTLMQHLGGLLGLPGVTQIPIQPAPAPNPIQPGLNPQPTAPPPSGGGGHVAY